MKSIYKRHRFLPSIIQYAVWLYYRFNLSTRDVEDLLAERNISVSYEAIRLWINKFGPEFTRRLRRRHRGSGDSYFLDEVFVKISGKQHYLWRAVDQDGEVVDVYLQERSDAAAAKRFFRRFLSSGDIPRKIVTDKLRSYGVAHRELIPESIHKTPSNTPTIEQSFPINPPASENEGCDDSVRSHMRNDSWRAMQLSTTYSICTDIRCVDVTSRFFVFDPSQPGTPLQPPNRDTGDRLFETRS
jgi:putative transposase